tara:strand:+ start:1342 stop:1542 length:201 start_codon:yes stop_codon:yes gene_type:complete
MTVRDWIDYYKTQTLPDLGILESAFETLQRDTLIQKHYSGDHTSHIYAIKSARMEMHQANAESLRR